MEADRFVLVGCKGSKSKEGSSPVEVKGICSLPRKVRSETKRKKEKKDSWINYEMQRMRRGGGEEEELTQCEWNSRNIVMEQLIGKHHNTKPLTLRSGACRFGTLGMKFFQELKRRYPTDIRRIANPNPTLWARSISEPDLGPVLHSTSTLAPASPTKVCKASSPLLYT